MFDLGACCLWFGGLVVFSCWWVLCGLRCLLLRRAVVWGWCLLQFDLVFTCVGVGVLFMCLICLWLRV